MSIACREDVTKRGLGILTVVFPAHSLVLPGVQGGFTLGRRTHRCKKSAFDGILGVSACLRIFILSCKVVHMFFSKACYGLLLMFLSTRGKDMKTWLGPPESLTGKPGFDSGLQLLASSQCANLEGSSDAQVALPLLGMWDARTQFLAPGFFFLFSF